MKDPTEQTLVELVVEFVTIKGKAAMLRARSSSIKQELLKRIPEGAAKIVAGWRIRKGWRNETSSVSVKKAHWALEVEKPSARALENWKANRENED